MSASSSGGTAGFRSAGPGGVSVATAISTPVTLGARNGTRPASIWYRTTPRLNRSVRASTRSPRACSGDMYAGVPTTAPVRVTASSPASSPPTAARARPKSRSFTRRPAPSSHTLPGFTSR